MGDNKSAWVHFRNALETMLEPEIDAGMTFLHAFRDGAKAEGGKDLKSAFLAGAASFAEATGSFEDKALHALQAVATVLIGDTVALVKNAVAETEHAAAS